MSDADIILELAEAIYNDPAAPVLAQDFNPTDPVAIEIVMHEADFSVESYMEKWKGFRDRFSDPSVYDAFVLEYQLKVRREIKKLIAAAQDYIAEMSKLDDEENEEET